MRHQIAALLCLCAFTGYGNEGETTLKIHQVDLTRHLVAVKVEGDQDYKELFVESEKGEQCSLPVKGQSEGILFLATDECSFEKKLRAGQSLSVSLFENLSSKEEKKEENSKPAGYEITWKALSYSRIKIDAEVEGDLKGSYELTQSDFKTLPLDFELNIKGENFGVLLEPVSDESTVGGTLAPYIKLPVFDLGITTSYFVDKKSEKLTIGTSTSDSDTKSETLHLGGFIRKVVASSDYKFDLKFSLGYTKNIKQADGDKVIVDYFSGGLDLSTYFRVREGLYVGPSVGLLVGDGTISWENSNDKLSSDTNVFAFAISPLVMNFEF